MSVLYKDNFLTPEEIEFCLNFYEHIDKEIGWESSELDFWTGRVFDVSNIMDKLGDRSAYGFDLTQTVYPDTMQIVKWEQGSFQPPHADNAEPDGTPNYTPWRLYSGLLYLNDDYEGGQTYFTNKDIEVQPKAGRVAIFYGDLDHEHGVREITQGERKTIVTFWCHKFINKSLRLG
jgi:predicted 2-oxoglutarate/Fe(II)-dependent dioxygenase YbiX